MESICLSKTNAKKNCKQDAVFEFLFYFVSKHKFYVNLIQSI